MNLKITQLHRLSPGLLLIAAVLAALLIFQAPALAAPEGAGPLDTPAQTDCAYEWFFGAAARPVEACASGPAVSSDMARLEFERGEMIWDSAENTIYILYRDFQQPYWESYPDTWITGMTERQSALAGPLGLWQQPRRGFGNLWATNPTIRGRLGWALNEWEISYEGWVQKADTANGPIVFFMREDGKAYQLRPGTDGIWDMFSFLG